MKELDFWGIKTEEIEVAPSPEYYSYSLERTKTLNTVLENQTQCLNDSTLAFTDAAPTIQLPKYISNIRKLKIIKKSITHV